MKRVYDDRSECARLDGNEWHVSPSKRITEYRTAENASAACMSEVIQEGDRKSELEALGRQAENSACPPRNLIAGRGKAVLPQLSSRAVRSSKRRRRLPKPKPKRELQFTYVPTLILAICTTIASPTQQPSIPTRLASPSPPWVNHSTSNIPFSLLRSRSSVSPLQPPTQLPRRRH